MIKNEPLKGKMKVMIGAKPLPEFRFFFADEVLSAVQGLVEELRDKRLSMGLYDEQYDEICEMIRKWFTDVVMEDETRTNYERS